MKLSDKMMPGYAMSEGDCTEVRQLEAENERLRAVTDDLRTVFSDHDEINADWVRKKLETLDD